MRVITALCAGAWALTAASAPVSAADAYSADAVKAAFLYRFTSYIEWPSAAVEGPQFTIEVLGADGVATELQSLLASHTVKNLPVRVLSIKDPRELGDAQILYIGPGFRGDLHRVIGTLSAQPILTVTDSQRGLESGSTINFLPVEQRVRFEVSISAAERSGLSIGSEMLSVAARVSGGTLQVSDAAH
jgi:YfiR/HmsC-like